MPFIRQGHKEKPRLYGSFQDRQYSIWRNLEDIYRVDHKSEVLIMPLFWGLPCLDYSGIANHGTNYGAMYKNGNLDFGEGDNYVLAGTSWDLSSGTFTFGCWAKADVIDPDNGDWDSVIGFYITEYEYIGLSITRVGGTAYWKIVSEGETPGQDSTAITTDVWYNVYIVWDGTDFNLYRNGQFGYSVTPTGSGWKTATDFLIGRELKLGSADYNYFNGTINEARISNIARTADQIALFHDRPWDLYRRVSRPIWSIPTPPIGAIMNQFQGKNLGADLFNGSFL